MAKDTRLCKHCGVSFKKKKPLDFLCSAYCAIQYKIEGKKNKESKNALKPINRVSDKRKKQEAVYSVVRKQHLKYYPVCELCGSETVEIHHKNGRNGERLIDANYFMTVCRKHHTWIHEHPKEAREKGWLI